MEAIIIFFIATIASIIGSLQAGIVNTAVLAHTVKRGPEAGRRMALGGAIPEFIYAAIAFQFASWLLDVLGLDAHDVAIIVGSVLIILGLYFVFVFKPVFDLEAVSVKATGIRKGIILGMLNPQLILFWSGVRLALGSFGVERFGWLETITSMDTVLQLFYDYVGTMIGASGAVFGVLRAFGMYFPNTQLFLLFPPIPIKAKYFVIGYSLLELFAGITQSPGDNVAHFAHLGGMLFGIIIIRIWRRSDPFA